MNNNKRNVKPDANILLIYGISQLELDEMIIEKHFIDKERKKEEDRERERERVG